MSEHPLAGYDAVEVFCATKAKERVSLGATLSRWLEERRGEIEVVDTVVRQSSDHQYHCLSVLVFYRVKGQ
ncbi:MAG: hypothetical protein VYD19_03060 [Myxococcota bacterium]|nr:hypothetical protein [Myxococcota bacterium]